MKYKVSIVGAIDKGGLTGHTNPKIFLYKQSLENLGFEVSLFSTKISKIFFIKILFNIISAFKYGDSILFMLGGAGCRKLTPFIVFFNKFFKKRIILNQYGTGPINPLLKNKDINFVYNFINKKDFGGIKDYRLGKKLAKYDLIMLETNTLMECFRSFYKLNNLVLLTNFRFNTCAADIDVKRDCNMIKIIFLSRIEEKKGILDLMAIINSLNSSGKYNLYLDIFGKMHLDEETLTKFNLLIKNSNSRIAYNGVVSNDKVQSLIKKYDLSCLPTKYGEGAPGFIIESLIAGTPVLSSSYSQVKDLINDNVNGFVFCQGDNDSLKSKLIYICENQNILSDMRKQAAESGKKLTFDFIKEDLVDCIIGIK